ncbi:hypothetical protein ACIBI4_17150 [Streptomyces sp. NPDC050418]|uniref:hypothetical protein n=1 Tax=Streptomyces sp. NPDC050418 TaxID=3365612 RepID=UPI0037945826
MGEWRKAWWTICAVAALAGLVALALAAGTPQDGNRGPDPTKKTKNPKPFTVAVVTGHAGEDDAAGARIALEELRATLRTDKSPGTLPLDFVTVPPKDGMTTEALRMRYPRLVAVIADEPFKDDGRSAPVVGTCYAEDSISVGFTTTVAPEVAEVGWQLRTYLAHKEDTRRLVIFGTYGTDAELAEELGERGSDAGWNAPAGSVMVTKQPGRLSTRALRTTLREGDAVLILGPGSSLAADLRALGRTGYRGPVLTATDVESLCGQPVPERPGRVPDGITLYRVDTSAPGGVRAKDCVKGNTERCPWLAKLPDRPGALEEYEAAQMIVRMYLTVRHHGKGEVPEAPATLADALAEGIGEQIVRSLGGWFDPSGEPEGHVFGLGHDIWLHRWTDAKGGRWDRLGPLSALYW